MTIHFAKRPSATRTIFSSVAAALDPFAVSQAHALLSNQHDLVAAGVLAEYARFAAIPIHLTDRPAAGIPARFKTGRTGRRAGFGPGRTAAGAGPTAVGVIRRISAWIGTETWIRPSALVGMETRIRLSAWIGTETWIRPPTRIGAAVTGVGPGRGGGPTGIRAGRRAQVSAPRPINLWIEPHAHHPFAARRGYAILRKSVLTGSASSYKMGSTE